MNFQSALRFSGWRTDYRWLAALSLCLMSCSTVRPPAQVAIEAQQGEPVYETDVRFDLENGALAARARLTWLTDDSTATQAAFLLNRGLQLEEVRGAGVRSYRSEPFRPMPVWNLVEVELDGSVSPGSLVTVEVIYAGTPEFPDNGINGISGEWVELNLDSQWHPMFASFDQAMRGVLRLELPRGWQVVASGSSSFENGFHVIRSTVPQPDVAFTAAPSLEQLRSERFTVYSRTPAPRAAAAVLEAGENCGRYLDERFGAQDPLPRGRLVLAERDGPGYARKNYIVLSEIDPGDAAGLHYFLCHELAHYWTPSPGPFSPDHWMSEAFAEYVAVRYVRESFGQTAYERRVARWEEMGRAHGPVWRPGLERPPTFQVMYRRAPYLLHQLEQRIGHEQFERFLERYMTEEVRSTPELLEQLEEVAGPEAARWLLEQLARGPDESSKTKQ